MELKIDDLLDGIRDHWVNIAVTDRSSTKRIRELTLARIPSPRPVPSGYRTRRICIAVLAAALILLSACAAATVKLSGMVLHTTEFEYFLSDDGRFYIPGKKEPPDWGIELQARDITATGMELYCTQSGGNFSGDLFANDQYYIEKMTDSGWEALPRENGIWGMDNTDIPRNSTHTWSLDWSEMYGELPPGRYRLCKPFARRESGNAIQDQVYRLEFALVED